MGYNRYIEQKESIVTSIFTQFCKGVTYFANEMQPSRWPIYHRNASCGSKSIDSNIKFSKTLYGPDKSKYVKRCVVERQIYNIIYNQIIGFQDLGHSLELEKVQRIYEKYFPMTFMVVKILKFQKDKYPVILQIEMIKDTHVLEVETYEKLYNDDEYDTTVICNRIDKVKNVSYIKHQTFDKYVEWNPI